MRCLNLAKPIELIAVSRHISESDKNKIINDVALANAQYFKLESLSNYNFDNQISKLNKLLLNNAFEKIHFELISLSKKQFSPSQRERLMIFKSEYEKKFESLIRELDSKIENAISKRRNDAETQKLLTAYSYTVFYKDQK